MLCLCVCTHTCDMRLRRIISTICIGVVFIRCERCFFAPAAGLASPLSVLSPLLLLLLPPLPLLPFFGPDPICASASTAVFAFGRKT